MADVERRYVEDSEDGEKGGRWIGERLRLTLKPFHLLEMTLTKLNCNMCTVLYIYIFILFYFFHRILLFEEKKKEKQRPQGVAPKRDLSSLP